MTQFDVHQNRNEATKSRYPLLLDVQSDLLDPLVTRVVIPMVPATTARTRSMETLTPALKVGGKSFVLMTPQVAAISQRELGPAVGNFAEHRTRILAALDMLITVILAQLTTPSFCQARQCRVQWPPGRQPPGTSRSSAAGSACCSGCNDRNRSSAPRSAGRARHRGRSGASSEADRAPQARRHGRSRPTPG